MTRPVVHARDHWRTGADPAATAWQYAGEGDNPTLEGSVTGMFRWSFDGDGDLALDWELDNVTLDEVVIYLPGAYWPSSTRSETVTAPDGTQVAVTTSAIDGGVTFSAT